MLLQVNHIILNGICGINLILLICSINLFLLMLQLFLRRYHKLQQILTKTMNVLNVILLIMILVAPIVLNHK